MSAAVHGLFDTIADIEQRVYALEVRLNPENHKNDRQSPRDRLHVVLMGPPCSGVFHPYIPVSTIHDAKCITLGKSTQASHIQDAFCLCHLVSASQMASQPVLFKWQHVQC